MNDIVKTDPLQKLIAHAMSALDNATSAAEILEAKVNSAALYDQAKLLERFAQAKGAHEALIATCRRMVADALLIEVRAGIRLADEYDAMQARGEVASHSPGRPKKSVPDRNDLPTAADAGLTRKEIHNGRKLSDAEDADPGVIQRAIDEALNKKRSPSKSDVKRAVDGALNKSKPKPTTSAPPPQPAAKPQATDGGYREQAKALMDAKEEIDRLRAENVKLSDPKALEILKRKLEYEYEVRALKLENEYIAQLEKQARDSVPPVQISNDVQTEVNRWLELLLPELHKERAKARRAVAKRKRVVTKAAFNRLLSAVHSDTGRHATPKERDAATRTLIALKPHVLDEADDPTQWDSDLPNDLAGWAERLHDAELKRRMSDIPQPKGMPLPPFLEPKVTAPPKREAAKAEPTKPTTTPSTEQSTADEQPVQP